MRGPDKPVHELGRISEVFELIPAAQCKCYILRDSSVRQTLFRLVDLELSLPHHSMSQPIIHFDYGTVMGFENEGEES
jgi:hypothetical protein